MKKRETSQQVSREARERLHPSITNPNWLVLSARRELFEKWIAVLGGSSLRILDVGGRIQTYRPLFGDRVVRYYSLDIVPGPCVSVIGRAEDLPFVSGFFDVVLCTQMLEYVPDPQQAIDEIHRVLRPGGYLLLSAPAVFPRDSDPEYWRFLPSSLQLLLRNFREIQIAAEGSSITGLLRTVNVALVMFSPSLVRPLLRYTAVPGLNLLGRLLERLARTNNDQLTANFAVFARK
jgi:SAM-dependent methyltransferase